MLVFAILCNDPSTFLAQVCIRYGTTKSDTIRSGTRYFCPVQSLTKRCQATAESDSGQFHSITAAIYYFVVKRLLIPIDDSVASRYLHDSTSRSCESIISNVFLRRGHLRSPIQFVKKPHVFITGGDLNCGERVRACVAR